MINRQKNSELIYIYIYRLYIIRLNNGPIVAFVVANTNINMRK